MGYLRAGHAVCDQFLDSPALVQQTGHPVRSDYKDPGDPDSLPAPDAVIVAPATVNTINKWAAGICDTLALGILVEGIGKRLPIVAMPFTNYAQAAHPAFEENIEKLRSWGVHVLYGPDVYPLHAPGTGGDHLDAFPWNLALDVAWPADRFDHEAHLPSGTPGPKGGAASGPR